MPDTASVSCYDEQGNLIHNPFSNQHDEEEQSIRHKKIMTELINAFKSEIEKRDICDANTLLMLGKLYSSMAVKYRDYGIFADIPGLNPSDLNAFITLSKIDDQEELCKLGLKFLKYIYAYGSDLKLGNLSILDVKKEFTDFNEITIEKYLIQKKLQVRKHYTTEEINNLWDAGLRLIMIKNKKIIDQIANSGNPTITIHGIINRYQPNKKKRRIRIII